MHALANLLGTVGFLLLVPACILGPVAALAAWTHLSKWLRRTPVDLDALDFARYPYNR